MKARVCLVPLECETEADRATQTRGHKQPPAGYAKNSTKKVRRNGIRLHQLTFRIGILTIGSS